MKFLIINGPNLDMLGKRDPGLYGSITLKELNDYIAAFCAKNGDEAEFFQSNCEGAIIDRLHNAKADAVLLNAGAYTHYSYAIRDAIECAGVPVCEVHLSDTDLREDFRKVSVIRDVVRFTVKGKKQDSYIEAINRFKEILSDK
jgi:3-dehydroquinate dehydratase-2